MKENLRVEQEQRALEYLNVLGISRLFSDLVKVGVENLAKFFADLYERPELEGYIKSFEEETGALVYYVTHDDCIFGECFSLLYISKYPEDWVHQTPRLCGDGRYIVSAWVDNVTREDCSEFGSIVVTEVRGTLLRIG